MVVDNYVDRTVVEQTDSEGQLCRLVVTRSNCHSLALCLPHVDENNQGEMPNRDNGGMDIQEFALLNSSRLHRWITLPGMPGNSIKLVETTDPP